MKKQFTFLKTVLVANIVLICLILSTGNAKAQYLNNLADSWSKAPTAAYSTRKVMSTYTGPAMRLRRSNDHQMVDVYFDSNGWVSMGSLVSASVGYTDGATATGITTLETWVGANSAYVVKWYDQSGNGNHATPFECTGTLTCTTSSTSITGASTQFTSELKSGTKIYDVTDGTYVTTAQTITNATAFTASGNPVKALTAGKVFTREGQPRFINAGVIDALPNGTPALYLTEIVGGTSTDGVTTSGMTTPMTLGADANVNVFAVIRRTQTNTANPVAVILGNFPNYNSASTGNFSAGFYLSNSMCMRSTLVPTLSTTTANSSNTPYALRFFTHAKKTTTTNEDAGIVQLSPAGTTTSSAASTGSITFNNATKLSLFKPITYAPRAVMGYCPEIIYYASTTTDATFNSSDASNLLADQRTTFMVVPTPPSNIQVGTSKTYKTIQAAYNAISNSQPISQSFTIELQSDYDPISETYPIAFGAISGTSATNTITIKPASGVKKVIGPANQTKAVTATVSSATTTLVLDDVTGLSTASYVGGNYVYSAGTFKQLSAVDAGTKTVTFAAGTFTDATAVSTKFFIGAAQTQAMNFNGAQYVIIDGVSRTDALTGLTIQNPNAIYAQTMNFTGNANNVTVQNCIIRGANQTSAWGSGYQGTIFFNGSNTVTFTNNDVCDMGDGSPYPVCAFQMTGSGTNYSNTISGNNIYNISNIYASTSSNSGFFQFGSTNNTSSHSNAILDNKIYFTGTAYLRSGSNVVGIGVGGNMNGTGNRFEGNVIGYANAESTGTSSLDMTGTSGSFKGAGNLKNFTCKNNIIGGITMTGGLTFTGIELATSNASSPAADDVCYGNQVKNITLNASATGSKITGIVVNASSPYNSNINNNIINNLTLSNTGTSNTCTVMGIDVAGSAAAYTYNYSGNQVYKLTAASGLSVDNSTVNYCYGIKVGGNANIVEKNLVYELQTPNAGASIRGMEIAGSNATGTTFQNNIIRLGSDVTTKAGITAFYQNTASGAGHPLNFYHNTFYIGGEATGTNGSNIFQRYTTNIPSYTFKNNIFSNKRSGNSTVNQIYVLSSISNIAASDKNVYEYNGQFAQKSAPSYTFTNLSSWNTMRNDSTLSVDGSIDNVDPHFTDRDASTPDMTINPAYAMADAKGVDLSVTDDYNGIQRSTLTPTDLGAYAYTSTATKPSVSISTTAASSNAVNPLPITFTFSAAVTGFTLSDIVVGNGTAANLATSNNITYTAEVTPTNSANPVTVDVAAGAAYDAVYYANNTAANQLFIKAVSTITATGTTSFTYNGSTQGPASCTKTGSTGAVTYSYVGVSGTSYGPSATAPSAVGSYTVTASVAADANYNAATSEPLAFTIVAAAITISSDANLSTYSPTSATDVTVSAGELTINSSVDVKSITVAPGAKLTYSAGVLNATNGITLQNTASGTASFMDSRADVSTPITGTVEQTITDINRNWYVAVPVAGKLASDITLSGAKIVQRNEAQSRWDDVLSGTALTAGVGYIAVASASTGNSSWSLGGNLNSGTVTVPVTRLGASSAGFNLLGNPYPSYLNWEQVLSLNATNASLLLPSIWYRTKSGANYAFQTYNSTGRVATPSVTSGYIPPMQAFWVRAISGGTVTFTNDMRSHGNGSSNMLKAPAAKNAVQPLVRLQIANSAGNDETVLYFNANASNAVDNYDTPKMFESASATKPEIFTQVNTEKLVINGLNAIPYNSQIPVGIVTKQAGNFTISANEMSNFEAGTRIILIDNLNKGIENELTNGIAYSFSAPVTTSTDRFSLIFRTSGATTGLESAKTIVNVYVNGDNHIVISAPEKSVYSIYNAMGQMIENGKLNAERETLNAKLAKGVYVVKVGNQSTRVIVK